MNETSISRPWAVAPPSGVEAFGAYVHWPESLDWSTQLLRVISYSSLGGSEFSEIMSAIRGLEVGDREAWLVAFSGLASELDQRASGCDEQGHGLSAIELWRRAAIYFRMATTFHAMDGIVELPAMQESRRCFQAAMTRDPRYRFETVEIPYEQYTLPGYLISPSGPPRPRPTVVVQGGIDAFSEEMWFKLGEALVRRGYAILLPDGPGQGESKRRGIGTRSDYEVAVTAFIDFLVNQDEVDSERIALVGSSMGGYFAARGAAFEPRLVAAVAWGAFYGLAPVPQGDDGRRRVDQAMATFAVDTVEELLEKIREFNLEAVANRIHIPFLVLHAVNDLQVPFAHAQCLFDEIPDNRKRLVAFPPDRPGCTHCQLDTPSLAQVVIADWLDDILEPK